jgi:ribosomal protein L35
MAVGLKGGIAGWAHMMQHENAADAREHRAKKVVRTGQIKRFQAGADDVAA